MVWMINKDTGNPQEFADEDVKGALRLGIAEFAEEKVPVKYYKKLQDGTRDPEDEVGTVRNYPRSEATARLIEDKDAYVINQQDAYDHWVDEKYGSGYEGRALALGVADIFLGAGTAAGELMGLPTREIAQANPWLHAIGDIGTSLGLIGITALSEGTAAPLTAPLLSKEGAKWAAKFGVKKAAKAAKYTPPILIHKAGQKVAGSKLAEGIATKILGEVGERSLKQHAAAGLFARTAALGTESMLYAGGYSVSDNLAELIHGDPDKAVENMIHSFGIGSALGMALPGVFHLGKMATMGAVDLGRRGTRGAIDYMANHKLTDKALADVARQADEIGVIQGQITRKELEDRLSEARLGKDANKAQRELVDRYDNITESTTSHVTDALRTHRDIRALDQAGHTRGALEDAITIIYPGTEGAASSSVLAFQLFDGVTDEKGVRRGGLLELLAGSIDDHLGKSNIQGLKPISARGRAKGTPSPQMTTAPADVPKAIKAELLYIRSEVERLQNFAREWVEKRVASLTGPIEVAFEDMPDWLRALHTANISENPRRFQNIVRVMATNKELAGELDQAFNAEVFSILEKLSSRVHTGILEGRFQNVETQQKFINAFKEEITSFLTGKKTWKGSGEFKGLFPFGDPNLKGSLAQRKLWLNALFAQREKNLKELRQHLGRESLTDKFTQYSPWEGDPVKIRAFISGINSIDFEKKLTGLKQYADNSLELLGYLQKNFNLPPGMKDFDFAAKARKNATKNRDDINRTVKFLQEDMEPALRYADMLKKEHQQMSIQHFGKGAMPGPLAAMLGVGTFMTGGGLGPALAVAAAPGLAKSRMAMTPMNSVVKINRMFRAIQETDSQVENFVKDYVRSFGKAKYPDKGFSRWPRLFTTNAIVRAKRRKQDSEKDYRHHVGYVPGKQYGKIEMKNTREAVDALSRSPGLKESLMNEVLAEVNSYAPEMAPLLKKKMDEYINLISKALPPTISYDMFSEDIEPSDTEIQEFAEKLSIYENGPAALFRSLSLGVVTDNEVEAMDEMYPSTMLSLRKYFMEHASDPEFKKNAPEATKNQIAMIIGAERYTIETQQVLRNTYAPKEEEKPGPKPQAKWRGDTSNIAQSSGTRVIESRRS